jgi:ABC-type transporter MlaC component
MRIAFVGLVVSALLASTCVAQAASCPAAGFITQAGEDFVRAAKSHSPENFANAAARYADIRSVALFALGIHRKDLPKAREAEYVSLTRKFMGKFMTEYSTELSGNGLTITACAGNLVTTKFDSGQSIIFRLKGARQIEDVNVSGIWLIQVMRTKFANVINHNGGDVNALLEYLKN